MKNISMLIKPSSSSCNLQCSYCFYHSTSNKRKESNKGFMNEKTLQAVVDKAFDCEPDSITFVFQGGEPTIIGLDFYKKFVDYVNRKNENKIQVQYNIQTNGVLINPEWCEFLKKYSFVVGVSLDGLEEIHNKYRLGNSGNFEKICEVIDLLNAHKIKTTVLTVVTPEISSKVEEVYNFYKEKNYTNLHFMPCIEDFNDTEGESVALSSKEFEGFLIKLFDMWYEDYLKFKFVHIRFFDNVVKMLNCYQPMMCGMQGKCSIQYVIEADGSVYTCDYYCLDEFQIGNINTDSLPEIFESENARKFIADSVELSENCKNCEVFPLCKGGCRRMRQTDINGTLGANKFCDAYKAFFDHVLNKFSNS